MTNKKNKKKEQSFKLWVKISNLEEDREKNPSRMFFVGKNLAKAELIMDKAKSYYSQMKAKARLKYAQKKVNGKKLTIPTVDAKVESDSKVLKAESDYLEAKYFFNLCKTTIVAMKDKGQQLTNITNSRNAELKLKFIPNEKSTEENVRKRFKKNKK